MTDAQKARARAEAFYRQYGRWPRNATELALGRPRHGITGDPALGGVVAVTLGAATGGIGAAALAAGANTGAFGMSDRWSIAGIIGAAAGGYAGGGGISGAIGGATQYLGGTMNGGMSGGPLPGQSAPPPTGLVGGCPPGTIQGPLGTCVNLPFTGAPGTGITTTGGTGVTFTGPMQGGNGRGGPAPSGYHWNKTSYFTKSEGWVPAGSKLVKNRRRNPLNPRAASRAISRLESAKKAVSRINRVSIRKPRCSKC